MRRLSEEEFPKHLIFHQARKGEILILRVVHSARDRESVISQGADRPGHNSDGISARGRSSQNRCPRKIIFAIKLRTFAPASPRKSCQEDS